ncbi:LLM class flavin-dependent oxidoreductase [Pseudonocardia xinjiangensis]|uniref:LLM class flavin-dependent oxidoreductase n=1 Tax=Pseudonocardia xinjiangensis TaxID=75289 RepID=UPI003D921590
MQIGVWIDDDRPLAAVLADVEEADRLGFSRAWFGQRTGWDPLSVIAAVGDRAPGIGLGTAVVVTWPHHPLALAAQALSTQAATGGRLTLGVGPSHQMIVENRYGYPWTRPGQHVEDHLAVLAPALRGEDVEIRTATVTAAGRVSVPEVAPPPLLLAAHGPRLLRLAGERADGVITTWSGPRGPGGARRATGARGGRRASGPAGRGRRGRHPDPRSGRRPRLRGGRVRRRR